MPPSPEKCVGNCSRDIAVGQTIFQVYVGGYWLTPYITPDPHTFLGNWCVDCFQRDYGRLIASQVQPYQCTLCGRGFKKDEQVIYATCGTRPAPPARRAEIRGPELHLVVGKEHWTDNSVAELYKICDLETTTTELERVLKGLRGANVDPIRGRKVRNPDLGVGTVVDVEGHDDDRRITVSFPDHGTKKFSERYAHWLRGQI
jgi:hypothetical protein